MLAQPAFHVLDFVVSPPTMSDPGGNFDHILPPLCSSVQIFWMIPPNLYDDILKMTMVTMTKMTPLCPRWQRRSYCESSFLTSLSHSSLMQVIIIEEINTPTHARNTIPTKWRQKYLKYKNLHSDLLGPPSSCPSHRSSDLEESGLGREIVNRLLIISDC